MARLRRRWRSLPGSMSRTQANGGLSTPTSRRSAVPISKLAAARRTPRHRRPRSLSTTRARMVRQAAPMGVFCSRVATRATAIVGYRRGGLAMTRPLYMLIALVCYTAFFVSFVYLIGFVAGYPALPTHVDMGLSAAPAVAAAIDIALIALFGLQHSIMARPGFKAGWTRIVPPPIERSVYCLAAAAALTVMFAFWHPIAGMVWSVENPAGRIVLWSLFALG